MKLKFNFKDEYKGGLHPLHALELEIIINASYSINTIAYSIEERMRADLFITKRIA